MQTVLASRFADFEPDLQSAVRCFLDDAVSASPYQDPVFWGEERRGLDRVYMTVLEGGVVKAFGLAIENYAASRLFPRLRALIFPKGPVIGAVEDAPAVLDAIVALARTRNMVSVEIQTQFGGRDGERLTEIAQARGWHGMPSPPSATLLIDVTQNEESLLANMKKETRREVNRAERFGISVRRADAGDWADFYEVLTETGRRKGFETLERPLAETLAASIQMAPDRGDLLVAIHEDAVVGGVVLIRAGPAVHYLYGATRNDGSLRTLPIASPLHWRAMQWTAMIGCQFYDFGGYDENSAGGVARFKRGFGGEAVHFQAPLGLDLNPVCAVLARLLCRVSALARGRGQAYEQRRSRGN